MSQVKLFCQFGPAKKNILAAEKNLDKAKLLVAKLDSKIQKFGADNAKARWVYNFLIAGTQPPPIIGGTAEAPTKTLQTILAMGHAKDEEFEELRTMLDLIEALNKAKTNRRPKKQHLDEVTSECAAVEKNLSKVRQQLAVIIDEAEEYLKKASEIKMDQSGRTAMSVDQAASHHYVDDMVSTDTLEMGGDDY